MKRQFFVTSIVLIVLAFKISAQTTMLSSNPLKKGEVLLYNNYQYYKTTTKYNWNTEKWDNLNDSLIQTFHKTLPMIGYGLSNRLSLYVQFPMSCFIQNEGNTWYFDDIVIMGRFAILPSSSNKTGLTLVGAVRLPTAKTGSNKNFSDGSTDISVGEIFSTRWYGNWRSHIKSDFTINTRNVYAETAGKELNIFLKQDYTWKMLKFSLTNQYYCQAKKHDEHEMLVEQSQKERLSHLVQIEYQLKNGIAIKPKFQVVSYSVGGNNFPYKLLLELTYKFSWTSGKES